MRLAGFMEGVVALFRYVCNLFYLRDEFRSMTDEEFKNLWAREAANYPGFVLEVLPLGRLDLKEQEKAA